MGIIDKGKPIKSVVIGAGQISEEHLKYLRDHNDIFLSAVCDLSLEKAKIEDEIGIECGRMIHELLDPTG